MLRLSYERRGSPTAHPVERFGRRWGAFALGDLLVLNLLTLVTELIGVSLGLGCFCISRYVSVPGAAAFLIGASATKSFLRWERAMYLCVATSLVPVALFVASQSGGRRSLGAAG